MSAQPAVALLSSSSYAVMLTSAGAGSSTWRDLDVTRWREDVTRDCWGQFYYVRDLSEDRMWSIGLSPCRPLIHRSSSFTLTMSSFAGAMAISKPAVPFV